MNSQDRATVMGASTVGYMICLAWVVTSDVESLWKWVFAIGGFIIAFMATLMASPDGPNDATKNS